MTPEREHMILNSKKIKSISNLHDWRYSHSEGEVTLRMYQEVGGEVVAESAAKYTEVISNLPLSENLTLKSNMKLTNGWYQEESGPKRLLPPVKEPKDLFLIKSDLTNKKTVSQGALIRFEKGWGCHQASKKKREKFPDVLVRGLRYFFQMGKFESATVKKKTLSPKTICDRLATYIREGKIVARAITEDQIRSWLSSEKQRNLPTPGWFRKGDPSCIWDQSIDNQSQQESGNRLLEEEEPEQEARLTFQFPVYIVRQALPKINQRISID